MVSGPEQVPCPAPAAGGVCLQAPAQSAAPVRDATRSILAQPQFHHPRSWVDRLDAWWHRALADVVGWLFSGNGLTYAGLVVAAALLVLAMVLAARFALRVQSDPAVRVHEDDIGRRPVDWRADADRHSAAGDWRQALRCQYRALVAELAERGVLDEVPGRTAREYEQQVRVNASGAAPAFDQASDLFESVWYGFEPCGPADLERFAALAVEVIGAEARRPRRALVSR